MRKSIIAHVRKKDEKAQELCSHLTRVSVLCGQFANKIGLKESGRVIGLLHDLGKASDEFDKYIRSAAGIIDPDADEYVEASEQKGKIDHSTAGAQIIYRALSQKGAEGSIVAQVLSLCVASHHSGLIDCLSPDGQDNFTRRMEKAKEKTHVEEALSYLDEHEREYLKGLLSDEELIKQVFQELKSIKEDNDSQETLTFKFGLLVQFLFSCLIDADRLNTADFEFPENKLLRNYGKYHPWDSLIERLNHKLKEFENQEEDNEINKLRKDVSQQCAEFAGRPKGLYQLTVPTGGGKTLSSLRFALNHADYHNMDRVFYIIPYTSIIDQNADEIRKILEDKDEQGRYLDKVVLEHHSNLTPEEETRRQNLLSENWDAPVVFTTQVQFLEALFSSGTRGVRRLHQLANAVIIFDEVQTIPVRCVHLFNLAVRFLVRSCGSTVVLCTATQPLLDKIEPEQRSLIIRPEQQIIPDVRGLFGKLKRVIIYDKRKVGGWPEDEVAELAEQEVQRSGSVLIVVNTKSSAQNLYQKLKASKLARAYHLSTNMCPAHRMDVLNCIKNRLGKKPTICISTQLIEAGVNIDFGSVIRYLAGLDSIAQAAGRCNRHGLRPRGNVYIVNPHNEVLTKLKDIRVGKETAERVLDEYKENPEAFDEDIQSPATMNRYYFYYFYARKEIMNYPVSNNTVVGRKDNLFDLLSTNPKSVQEHQRISGSLPALPLKQSFQSASKAFRAIDSPTRGVIVQYGSKGRKLVNLLCSIDFGRKSRTWFKLLKRAQRFSVNIYPYILEDLVTQNAIHEVQKDTGVYYLDAEYYDNDVGLSKEIVNESEPQTFEGGVYG